MAFPAGLHTIDVSPSSSNMSRNITHDDIPLQTYAAPSLPAFRLVSPSRPMPPPPSPPSGWYTDIMSTEQFAKYMCSIQKIRRIQGSSSDGFFFQNKFFYNAFLSTFCLLTLCPTTLQVSPPYLQSSCCSLGNDQFEPSFVKNGLTVVWKDVRNVFWI